ncbi:hypothetical protein QG098_06595, partial [Kingella kingae]|uniref:hypothetical protein n=1 Tax=Kingella kingae TaxID=504 RepID=UPI002555A96D
MKEAVISFFAMWRKCRLLFDIFSVNKQSRLVWGDIFCLPPFTFSALIRIFLGQIAQSVEQRIENP